MPLSRRDACRDSHWSYREFVIAVGDCAFNGRKILFGAVLTEIETERQRKIITCSKLLSLGATRTDDYQNLLLIIENKMLTSESLGPENKFPSHVIKVCFKVD